MTQLPPQPGAPAPTSGKATGSLVCGILGIICCGIFAIVAYILGNQAEQEIAASGGSIGGAGLAKVGKILGIIGIVLWILAVIFNIIRLVMGA